jgi:hypothetical protein
VYRCRGGTLSIFTIAVIVVRLARFGHSFITPARKDRAPGTPIFTPARKDRAPGTPIQWNGHARFSFSTYTNSENALVPARTAESNISVGIGGGIGGGEFKRISRSGLRPVDGARGKLEHGVREETGR